MLSPILALGFGAALTNAVAIRGSECSFHLTAGGAITGPVGEISSGQVRAGKVSSTTFNIKGDEVWDDKGKGCWWTPPTYVLQCDVNQDPDNGFNIGCDGTVSYRGQTTFFECQTGEDGQYNLYLHDGQGQNCGKVTLKADGCHKDCPPPPPPPSKCPDDLKGPYEFPHLIVPVDKSKPDMAHGTSYFGEISTQMSSIFNFDIPPADKGKKCSLVFLLPRKETLETSDFTLSGSGQLSFTWLKEVANKGTTYNNQPGKSKDLGSYTVSPGNKYEIAMFDCPAGQTIAFEMTSAGDTALRFFQDYNPCPIGLYIKKH